LKTEETKLPPHTSAEACTVTLYPKEKFGCDDNKHGHNHQTRCDLVTQFGHFELVNPKYLQGMDSTKGNRVADTNHDENKVTYPVNETIGKVVKSVKVEGMCSSVVLDSFAEGGAHTWDIVRGLTGNPTLHKHEILESLDNLAPGLQVPGIGFVTLTFGTPPDEVDGCRFILYDNTNYNGNYAYVFAKTATPTKIDSLDKIGNANNGKQLTQIKSFVMNEHCKFIKFYGYYPNTYVYGVGHSEVSDPIKFTSSTPDIENASSDVTKRYLSGTVAKPSSGTKMEVCAN